MAQLAKRLEAYGPTTFHDWNDTSVIPLIHNVRETKTAVIGFSLGANQLGWIDSHILRDIDLGVAYDPSRQSPLVTPMTDGSYIQRAPHFRRLLCYHNPGTWFYGGSRYVGSHVETIHIDTAHLAVQFSEELHGRTIAAVKALEKS